MKAAPAVIDFKEHGLKARDLMPGIEAFGASRAWLYEQLLREKVVKDFVGTEPVLLVVGADNAKDYWFDWRNYHPETTVYGKR